VAVYLEERRAELEPTLIVACEMIDSLQCDHIFGKHGQLSYVSAVLHLRDLVAGNARPCGGLSHAKAWSIVTSRYMDPLGELKRSATRSEAV
jgi:hypothetical protein